MKQLFLLTLINYFIISTCMDLSEDLPNKSIEVPRETITQLMAAVLENDLPRAIKLLMTNVNINQQDQYGNTALHWAVMHDKQEFIDLLLIHDAEVNILDHKRFSPLGLAVNDKKIKTVKLLIDNGANPTFGFGKVKKIFAEPLGDDLLEILINAKHKWDHDQTYISTTCIGLATASTIDQAAKDGFEHDMMVEILEKIKEGLNLKITNNYNETLLTKAQSLKYPRLANMLQNIMIKLQPEFSKFSVLNGSLTKSTLEPMIDEEKKDNKEYSQQVLYAAKQTNHKMLKQLIDLKADINAQDEDGNTPIHWAIINENKSILKLLLASKARIDIKNKAGLTAIELAKGYQNQEIIKLIYT